MEYINTKTGVVVTVSSEISGGDWQPVKVANPTVKEKPETPKKKTKEE